jgi:hypothetical protein
MKNFNCSVKFQLIYTTGIYVIEPESIVQDPDIPGEVTREANFDQDALNNGRDTTGLFDVDNTTILTIEPPGDTTYILGPDVSDVVCLG